MHGSPWPWGAAFLSAATVRIGFIDSVGVASGAIGLDPRSVSTEPAVERSTLVVFPERSHRCRVR